MYSFIWFNRSLTINVNKSIRKPSLLIHKMHISYILNYPSYSYKQFQLRLNYIHHMNNAIFKQAKGIYGSKHCTRAVQRSRRSRSSLTRNRQCYHNTDQYVSLSLRNENKPLLWKICPQARSSRLAKASHIQIQKCRYWQNIVLCYKVDYQFS